MRKKRILAILLATTLMFTSLIPVAAQADSIGKEAQVCRSLGILLGSDGGVTPEYLAQNPTRLQAYIIALRLKGLYTEAGKFTSNNNFTDASLAAWAKNYLAYAKNTPALGWSGYTDGRFGVNDKINSQAFYKVMLETLGYKQNMDFTYAGTLDFAEKIGLVDKASDIAGIKSFTIDDIAKGIYKALNTTVAGTNKKLVETLVSKGIFKQQVVDASGLNSNKQISVLIDDQYGIAWAPIKETFEKMGGYVTVVSKQGMYFEIKKDTVMAKITEGITTAYVNSTKYTLEKPIIKNSMGVYYVPLSFVTAAAGEFGYETEYMKAVNILDLREKPVIQSAQDEIVILKGAKKSITVNRRYFGLTEDVTKQCTFAVANGSRIVELGNSPWEVTGNILGTAEVVIGYGGKEVDRVAVHVVDVVPTYYPTSSYEQVFTPIFRMDKPDYTDAYGVVWNKMPGVIATLKEDEGMDTGSSLSILNYSGDGSGISINLGKLLENRALKGKTCTLKLAAKGVTESPTLYVKASSKSKYQTVGKDNSIKLNNMWKGFELLKIDIPSDATEFTLSIATGKNAEIKIDSLTLTVE